jgi:integrase
VLAMRDTDYKVEDGERWLHVAQHKTGKRLWIYCHVDLWPAIEDHIARHRKGQPDTIGAPLIQNTKGETFNRRVFVMRWDRTAVRAKIVTLAEGKGVRRSRENPTRHDLRRNATTYLAEAGCTDDQISAITGLSKAMIQRQVYNVRTKAHAKAGIKKLEDYRK